MESNLSQPVRSSQANSVADFATVPDAMVRVVQLDRARLDSMEPAGVVPCISIKKIYCLPFK